MEFREKVIDAIRASAVLGAERWKTANADGAAENCLNVGFGQLTGDKEHVNDCSLAGDLQVGPGATVIGCRVAPGSTVRVGSGCFVKGCVFDGDVTIGEGSIVVNTKTQNALELKLGARSTVHGCCFSKPQRSVGAVYIADGCVMLSTRIDALCSVSIGEDVTMHGSNLKLSSKRGVRIGDRFTMRGAPAIKSSVDELIAGIDDRREHVVRFYGRDSIIASAKGCVVIGDDVRINTTFAQLIAQNDIRIGDRTYIEFIVGVYSQVPLAFRKLVVGSDVNMFVHGLERTNNVKRSVKLADKYVDLRVGSRATLFAGWDKICSFGYTIKEGDVVAIGE